MKKIFRLPKFRMAVFLLLIFISVIIYYPAAVYYQPFLIALFSTVIFDLIFLKLRRVKPFFPRAAIVTGLIIGLITWPDLSRFQLAVAGGLAMLSKNFLRVGKRHIFNPAAFGLFFSHLIFGKNVSWWAVSWQQFGIRNPELIIPFLVLLLPGWVSAVRLRRFVNIAAFFAVYALFNQVILDPAVIFFGLVMLPEPMTTPSKLTGQLLFGAFVAVFSLIIRFPLPDVFVSVLLLGNLLFSINFFRFPAFGRKVKGVNYLH